MPSIILQTAILTSPKFSDLSHGAFRLWITALMWSRGHLSDGFLPVESVRRMFPRCLQYVKELTIPAKTHMSPLWEVVDGGYVIHDYADWQDTKGDVQEKRRKWREKKRLSRGESTVESTVDSTGESKGESRGELHRFPQAGVGSVSPRESREGLSSSSRSRSTDQEQGAVENVQNCPRCNTAVPTGQRFCASCLRELLSQREQHTAEVGRL